MNFGYPKDVSNTVDNIQHVCRSPKHVDCPSNNIRIVTFLVLASFIPQIRHAWLRKEGGRVSLNYLQLNLICSTENLFLAFFFTVNADEDVPIWAHAPRIALDWVNLAQFVGIWILFNFL